MTLTWFGAPWGAAVCDDFECVPPPVGRAYAWCGELIYETDAGLVTEDVAQHRDCFIRMIAGGLNHQLGQCTCCGGTLPPDPPTLSARAAATAAADYANRSSSRWLVSLPSPSPGDVT